MKKRITSLFLTLLIAVSAFSLPVFAENTTVIKNIIYLIPDGGGYALYDFSNMVKVEGGFNEELFPYKTPTDKEPMSMRSQLAGSMTTAPVTGGVTDSAAAGTAMATGYKTINGYIGIDKNGIPKANLVEAAESVGKATGIISTYQWSHATPAAFTAHASSRSDEYNIYQQIENKGLEVVLGVGYGNVSQYASIQNAIDAGYTIIETKDDLSKVTGGDKIWGNVDEKGIPYDVLLEETQPTLAEMTEGAITALSEDTDGFFLMVEGGKVDTGGHANSANTTTSEYLAFDAAFKVALDFAKGRTDTVVICAPDHDTGGMIIPQDPETLEAAVSAVMEGKNPESITWTTSSHTDQNVGVWAYVPEGVDLIEGLNTTLGDTEDTRANYVIDNTAIAPWCAELMGVDLEKLSGELFLDVTTIGEYNVLERKFTFNNGDGSKYVYSNQDEYYKDGVKIPTNGKTSMYINNKFYVPAEMVEEEDWNYVSEVEDRDGITGTGSASDPYILDDAYDFMEFTANMVSGINYGGKYIRQIKDIDLSAFSEYQGIGEGAEFAGTYDGNGKKIKVSITSDKDTSVFPKVSGVLMNVGTEGTIISNKSNGYAAGIAYYIGTGGKIINCYSNAKIQASYAGGITTFNRGLIGNASFCGALNGIKASVPIGIADSDTCEFLECYYLKGVGTTALDVATAVTETQAKTLLAEKLNSNRKGAASKLGYSTNLISYWTNDYGYPVHHIPIPIVESVTITPDDPTVNRGEGIALSAAVTGLYNPSQEVTWSIEGEVSEGTTIDEDGYLVIGENESAKSFKVMAKSDQDGGIVDVITVTVGNPVNTEPDGSRITVSITTATGGSVTCDNVPVSGSISFVHGEEITIKALPEEGAKFKAWINATTRKVISTDEEYTFTAYTNRKIFALFADENEPDDVFVSFISKNNQYIYYNYLTKGTDVATIAPSPEKMYVSGYTWNGFIPQPEIVNESTDYKGDYTKNSDVYEIKISGGTDKKGNTEITLGYNASCTVIANAPATGKTFTGWLVNGKLASLNPEYKFNVFGDMTIEATYASSVEDVPFVTLLDITKWINGDYNMVSLTGTSYLPEGYTFSEAGILYVKTQADAETLILENEGEMVSGKEIKRTSVTENQMFKLTASYTETGITTRGYLVYLDSDGAKHIVYTDITLIHDAPTA